MKGAVASVALLLFLSFSLTSCADTSSSPFSEEHWNQLKHGGIKAFAQKPGGITEMLVLRGSENPRNPSIIDLEGLEDERGGPDGDITSFIKGQIDLAARTFQYSLFNSRAKGPISISKGVLSSNDRLEGTWENVDHPGSTNAFSYIEKPVTDKDQLSLRIDELRKTLASSLQAAADKGSAAPAPSNPTPPTPVRSEADVKINAYINDSVSTCQGRRFSQHTVRGISGSEIYEFNNFGWAIDDRSNTITQLGRLNGLEFTAIVHVTYVGCRKLDSRGGWTTWGADCPPLVFEIKKQNGKWTIDDNDASRGILYSKPDCNKLPL